jgi:phosphatidylinositol alpha-1,6-mannosyltransferase
LDFFTPGPKPVDLVERYSLKSAPTILCVGRLVKRKGQDKLISALPKIKEEFPNVKLLVVGEGPLGKKLFKLVKKLGLEDNVIFTGRVSYEELPKYFRVGDIFAMPARTRNFGLEVEGLGIVYLEASATGLPVIVGSSGGAPDALIQGETGYVVDGRNTLEIARQISYLIRDPESARRLGAKGRDWIESNWSWQLWGEKFAEVLRG